MQTALHQHAGASKLDGLANFFVDRVEIENIALFGLRPFQRTIKSTEGTKFRTKVCVIYVAIDDVSGNAFRMQTAAYGVGFHADSYQIVRVVEVEGLSVGEGHGDWLFYFRDVISSGSYGIGFCLSQGTAASSALKGFGMTEPGEFAGNQKP